MARWGAALYALALAYGTLYPLSDWRNVGARAFDFLSDPLLPRYWTWFDLLANVAMYLPLGLLGTLALRPLRLDWRALLAVTLAGSLLSLGLEGLQTWLPTRIPASLDWVANTAGTLLGALAGRIAAPLLLERGPLPALRSAWFRQDASTGLVLLGLWVAAQLQPAPLLLGTGEVVGPLLEILRPFLSDSGPLLERFGLGAPPVDEPFGWHLAPDRFILIEALAVACAICGVGAVALETLRPGAPRAPLVAALLAAALAARASATWLVPAAPDALSWLSAGAQAGLLAGAVALFAIASLRPITRLRAGGLLLAMGVLLVNVAPENAYYAEMIARWDEGRWLNFNGMIRFVSTAWPYGALAYLARRAAWRGRRRSRR